MSAPMQVDQGDYIAVLEEEVTRERRARLLMTAMLRSKERALTAYVERYGDITQGVADDPADVADLKREETVDDGDGADRG